MRMDTLGGLTVRLTGGTDGKGGGNGPLVVLLHGFGAPGDDLVPLSEYLDAPTGTRFLFPEAPISIPMGFGDSRAWWMIDMARIQADRAAGQKKLGADPERTVLGGFSQGAMLSCDALLHSTQSYAGLIQLSGTLVAKQEWAPLLTKRKGLPLFQSHGTQDPILPYAMAERLRDEFLQAGVSVDWQPFRGGHEIPEPVLRKLGSFLLKAVR